MVEKFMQLGPNILDKEETGVESALYIFVPSLMSDQVWFGTPAQPLDTDPPPLHSAQYARITAKRTIVAFSLHQQAT